MSRLDELIQKFNPDGVEYLTVSELIKKRVIRTITPSFKVKRNDYKPVGTVPIISQEEEFISGYYEKNNPSISENEYVCFGDHSEHIKYVNFAFVQGADGLKIMTLNKEILKPRYFYHAIGSYYMRHNNYERHFKYLCDTKIPIPHPEIQSEIVRILDNFTELTARKKQYEYYRDKLLSFDTLIGGASSSVQWLTLGELGVFYGGLTGKSKDDFKDGNAKFITYRNVYSNPALKIDVDDRVKIAEGEKQRTLQYGDVVFTGSSETPDECGISSVVTLETDEKLYLNSFCFFFRFNDLSIMLPDFAKHLFRSSELRYQIGKTASGVTRYNVSKKLMEKVTIPVPPLDVQQRIVHVLDNFDAICSDLNIGLPAEIEARKKQYEFYRDKLLTFDIASATISRQTDGLIKLFQYVFGVATVRLDTLFEIKGGYTPSKKNKAYWENGTIPWFRMEDIRDNGHVLNGAIQSINESAVKKELFKENSIIVATSATIEEHALITVPFVCNQRFSCLTLKEAFRDVLDMKYMFYQCFILDDWCKQNVNEGNFASVDMKRLEAYTFVIPSMQEQKRSVIVPKRHTKGTYTI